MPRLLQSIHPSPGDHKWVMHLLGLIERFAGRHVAVIGDLIADEFIYGQLSRVSREAPVLIIKYDRTTILPGGAGNAASNIAAYASRARLVGLVGRSGIDRRLVRSLRHGVERSWLIQPAGYQVPVKTRILAGGLHTARQQIVRVDREASLLPDQESLQVFERAARRAVTDCDALLVSDYGSGLITPALVARLKAHIAKRGRGRTVPILVDSRHNLMRYRGLTACTPSEFEMEQALGITIGDETTRLERAGRKVLKQTRSAGVVVTRGSRGMAVFAPGCRTEHIPIYGSDEVADVTGAGDTVIATMTLALAAGASLYEAARLANYAGGLVVMKRGTAAVTRTELSHAVRVDNVS